MDTVTEKIKAVKAKSEEYISHFPTHPSNDSRTLLIRKHGYQDGYNACLKDLEQLREEQKPEAKEQMIDEKIKEAISYLAIVIYRTDFCKEDHVISDVRDKVAKAIRTLESQPKEQLQPQQEALKLLKRLFEQYDHVLQADYRKMNAKFDSKLYPTYEDVKKFLSEADKGEPNNLIT